uniref:Uncharacterized protein n=1 Tax=Myoviridae sp. ctCo31 TaxID=2825053 RepID=A0A8S5UM67_9CAUD|nr:MAG TPA: hypothetical protein [Myoviridae sp. ctCo31]
MHYVIFFYHHLEQRLTVIHYHIQKVKMAG